MHRRFCLVYEDHGRRIVDSNLPNHFRTDGTCCSGYKNYFILEQFANSRHIYIDFVARKKVFNIHVLQAGVRQVCDSIPLFGKGHHHYADSCREELVYHLVVLAEFLRLHRRNQQSTNSHFPHQTRYTGTVHIHPLAKKGRILHLFAIRNEGLQTICLVLDCCYALSKTDTACFCSIDCHWNRIVHVEVVVHTLDNHSHHPHKQRGNEVGGENSMRPNHRDIRNIPGCIPDKERKDCAQQC